MEFCAAKKGVLTVNSPHSRWVHGKTLVETQEKNPFRSYGNFIFKIAYFNDYFTIKCLKFLSISLRLKSNLQPKFESNLILRQRSFPNSNLMVSIKNSG